MAVNEELNNRVTAALAHLPDVKEKKMFGRIAFMVNGKMCITSGDDYLMLRIDPDSHDKAIQKEGCQTTVMKGKEYKGYVRVKENSLKNDAAWDYWIGLALDYNQYATASKNKKKGVKRH